MSHSTRTTLETALARLLFNAQWLRLRLDSLLSSAIGRGRQRRVAATACWAFPIYSQTFVYQELTQLMKRGFSVRFFYGHLDRDAPLSPQFRSLSRARRRVIFHAAVCDAAMAYFTRRFPDRVERVVDLICRETGLSPAEVRVDYHFKQAFAFSRLVEAYQPGYLHSYFFYEGTLFAMVASELLQIPRGVSCYADHMLDDYRLKLVALHLRSCRAIVATSQRIKNELIGIEPAARSGRIVVKPNGINPLQFPFMTRTSVTSGRFRLVSVCRLEPKKGLIELVEAVGLLRDRNLDVELHLLGGTDDSDSSRTYAEKLRSRITALGLEGIVSLAGRRSESEINEYFRTSHVFVAPFVETDSGDKDGIPTSLLEGMASGLPVVATNAGSILEVITDGVDGLIVPQRDPVALADAIAALQADAERRALLGANAAGKVRTTFDAALCERVFHDHLTNVLAETTHQSAESRHSTAV